MSFIASIFQIKNPIQKFPKNSLFIEEFSIALGAFNEKIAFIWAGMPKTHAAAIITSRLAIHPMINVMSV